MVRSAQKKAFGLTQVGVQKDSGDLEELNEWLKRRSRSSWVGNEPRAAKRAGREKVEVGVGLRLRKQC